MMPIDINELNIKIVSKNILIKNEHIDSTKINICINDFRDNNNKVSDDDNIIILSFIENIKLKIYSPHIRTIELFQTNTNDFFGIVYKFHLPCVRAYYQDNVYMMPSCITAMLTGINITYNYFHSIINPVDIIDKYRMRGYSTILNEREKKYFKIYYENKNKNNKLNLFGNKELYDNIYKPLYLKNQLPSDIYKNLHISNIKNNNELKKIYHSKYNYDFNNSCIDLLKYKVIKNNGSIQPYMPWIAKIIFQEKQEQPEQPEQLEQQEQNMIINCSNEKKKYQKLIKIIFFQVNL